MKSLVVVIGLLIGSFSAHALECINGEEVRVRLERGAGDTYVASVTVQSVGDSYPSYRFRGLRVKPAMPGGPSVYENRELSLAVRSWSGTIEGVLDAPSLGLKRVALRCRE